MGWILVNSGTHEKHLLRPGSLQIGRAQTCQLRTVHQSVSRVHAEIVVEQHKGPLSEVAPTPICIIDRSSTGHTFVSGKPSLGRNEKTPLAHRDSLAFGVDPATYTLRWAPFVLSYSSRMPAAEARAMEESARAAGVFLTPEWSQDCTHLIMEQLAITPKLLCCIADGGLPVAGSFLTALAACEVGGKPPEAAEHRPRPPTGVDAGYEEKLRVCFESPKPRKSMLAGVWILFGLRQAYDALSVALLHAGSQVHLLCTTEAQVSRVAAELRGERRPKEVWLVPAVEERLAALLAAPLREAGVPCLTVSHGAVVAGILAGTLEAVHAMASPFSPASGTAASFPETQRQAEKAEEKPFVAKVKEEENSFPNTLPQRAPPEPTMLTGSHGASGPSLAAVVQRKKQTLDRVSALLSPTTLSEEKGAAGSTARHATASISMEKAEEEKVAVKQETKLESRQVLKVAATVRASQSQRLASQPVPSLSSQRPLDLPPSFSQKRECPEPAMPPPASQRARLGESQTAKLEAAKPELAKAEVTKCERPEAPRTEPLLKAPKEEPGVAEPEPVRHPTGTWLQGLTGSTPSTGREEVVRASWTTGVEVMAKRPRLCSASQASQPACQQRKGFKAFRKSPGQLPRRAGLVQTVPWAPAAARLEEVFNSQPMDSQGEVPLVNLAL